MTEFSWIADDILRHFPALEVKTFDTLGVGDVLHGIFALGLQTEDYEENSIHFASAAEAIHCSRPSSRHKSTPNRDEIKKFLRNNE